MITVYLVSVIVLALVSMTILKYTERRFDFWSTAVGFFAICGLVTAGLLCVFGGIQSYRWFSADYKARIINREYNTNYTREEIFYASDVIEIIHEIKRQRNEVKVEVK